MLTKVAFIRVESGRHSSDVSCGIDAASLSYDRGEADEHGGLLAFLGKERCCGKVGMVAIGSEDTVCSGTPCMDHTFGHLIMDVSNTSCAIDNLYIPSRGQSVATFV